jgi:hypothetical protein
MLKRNPELVMEAFGLLLTYTNLDLSQYAMEILPCILSQARHSDEARRKDSLQLVTQLVLHTSDLDAVAAMFQAVKSIIAGTLHALLYSIFLGCLLCLRNTLLLRQWLTIASRAVLEEVGGKQGLGFGPMCRIERAKVDPFYPGTFLCVSKCKILMTCAGSEGKLVQAYQRVAMVNSLQILSSAHGGKAVASFASSSAVYLMSVYKDDGM